MIASRLLRAQDGAATPDKAQAHSGQMSFLNRMRGISDRAVLYAACLIVLMPPAAHAQTQPKPFAYSVDLNVPQAYRKLLQDHLEIYTARDNPRMSADQLRFLVRRTPEQIRELLATEGYYSPTINSSLAQRQGAWHARFVVAPGEPSRVATVDLELRGAIPPAARSTRLAAMRKSWPLRTGMVFRQAQWEAAKRGMLQLLLTEQYPAANVAFSRATVDPKTRQVSLKVVLDSGPAFTLGALEISGLKRYPRSIVDRLNTIKPGSPYSQAKLLQLQAQLQDSRYFTSVTVSADVNPARPQRVPVKVRVVEAQSRKLGFGAGASTNTGPRAQVEYQDLNFLRRAWRLSSLLKLDRKTQSLSGKLQLPRNARGYVDSLNALAEHTNIQGQTTHKLALGAKRSRVTGATETAYGLQFETERDDIAGAPSASVQALVPNYSWTRRKLDNLLYPSSGYLLNVQVGVAAKALLSDQDFVRGYIKSTYYHRLGKRDGLILRAAFGATLARSSQGIPSDYLFRAGGDQSVRGYAYQSLGVKSGDAIVGGRYLGVASAEYVHWLSAKWGAAVFYDMGNAAGSLRDFKPVRGYGVGARWKSPIGLLNLDIAYGQAVRKTRIHFSVGVPF